MTDAVRDAIRILIVDDHEMVRAGLRMILEEEGFAVVGMAASAEEALAEALQVGPDVVLMDLRLPGGTGVEACRDILSALERTRVLILTSFDDDEAAEAALLAGASGFLLKDIGRSTLVRAITDAAASPRRSPDSVRGNRSRFLESRGNWLSKQAISRQERRVLLLVVEGKTNREIGASLGLSEKTVKNYLSNAFQKLGVARRAQAAAFFERLQRK